MCDPAVRLGWPPFWTTELTLKKGKTAVIVGAQWGDEGKGKIVDVLSHNFSVVARYAGGHNAGHTVIINGKSSFFSSCLAACCEPDAAASSAME